MSAGKRKAKRANTDIVSEQARHIETLIEERYALARLASDRAEFFNPIHVYEAKRVRDRVLKDRRSMPDSAQRRTS